MCEVKDGSDDKIVITENDKDEMRKDGKNIRKEI